MKKILALILVLSLAISTLYSSEKPILVGLIGLDTSHAPAFTKFLNETTNENYVPGTKVVAAYAGGSPDVEASYTRVEEYTNQIRDEYNVEIVATISELLEKVDAIILTSVDGQVHLEQARPVILAKKPVFIDKPMAASLEDVFKIFDLAKKKMCPVGALPVFVFTLNYRRLSGIRPWEGFWDVRPIARQNWNHIIRTFFGTASTVSKYYSRLWGRI